MNIEFIEALEDLEKEKNIPKSVLLEAIEAALISAYKKNYGTSQNVRVAIDDKTGDIAVLMRKDIVENVEDEMTEMPLDEAQQIDSRYEVGDYLEFAVDITDFGRIAAQTANHVVVQRIRENERNMIYEEFTKRKGENITGMVQRRSGRTIFINIGAAEGILPEREQVPGERYSVRQRLKVYINDVKWPAKEEAEEGKAVPKSSSKGPQVFLSRSHPGLVKNLFEFEVPEIQDGIVEVKGIAREAGSRTKMAVYSDDENVDPVGACVGTRGSRVQSVVDELNGEKIDIIEWSEDPVQLIANVLKPAQVEAVYMEDEDEKIVTAIVPDYQLSLAIGKQGQNVRLAAKVSGWKIDIKSHTQFYGDGEELAEAKEDENLAESEDEFDNGMNIGSASSDDTEMSRPQEHDIQKDEDEFPIDAANDEKMSKYEQTEENSDGEETE